MGLSIDHRVDNHGVIAEAVVVCHVADLCDRGEKLVEALVHWDEPISSIFLLQALQQRDVPIVARDAKILKEQLEVVRKLLTAALRDRSL